MLILLTFLGLAGAVLAYILLVRPLLERAGVVRPLPLWLQGASGRMRAFLRHSLSVLWGWLVSLASAAALLPQLIADFFNEPDIKAQIQQLLGPNAKLVAGLFLLVGVMTILARLRSARMEG